MEQTVTIELNPQQVLSQVSTYYLACEFYNRLLRTCSNKDFVEQVSNYTDNLRDVYEAEKNWDYN